MGVIGIFLSIPMHTSQYFHQIQFILCSFGKHLTFSIETMAMQFPPHKVRKEKAREPKAVLIRLSDVISSNDETDLSSSTKTTFHTLTTSKISKSKSISFWQKPTFC